jgi:hypothetical protein
VGCGEALRLAGLVDHLEVVHAVNVTKGKTPNDCRVEFSVLHTGQYLALTRCDDLTCLVDSEFADGFLQTSVTRVSGDAVLGVSISVKLESSVKGKAKYGLAGDLVDCCSNVPVSKLVMRCDRSTKVAIKITPLLDAN